MLIFKFILCVCEKDPIKLEPGKTGLTAWGEMSTGYATKSPLTAKKLCKKTKYSVKEMIKGHVFDPIFEM